MLVLCDIDSNIDHSDTSTMILMLLGPQAHFAFVTSFYINRHTVSN